MNLAEQWDVLLNKNLPEGLSRKRLPSSSDSDVFLAVRSPERHPVLLIGLDRTGADRFRRFEAEALSAKLELIGHDQWAVCVELEGTEFIDIFASLSEDLIRRVDGRPGTETASIIATRLERWHDLLHRRRRLLSPEAQRGLVAELAMLRLIDLAHPSSPLHTVSGWRGPSGASQDFIYDDFAIEVKGAAPNALLSISSVPQLWPPEHLEELFLAVFEVRPDDEGQPLAAHVNTTRSQIAERSDDAALRLELQLDLAGWSDRDTDRYTTAWVCEGPTAHRVADGFPRIDPDELPVGITLSKYHLNRESIAAHRVPEHVLTAVSPTANKIE